VKLRALYLAAPLLVVAAMLAPAVAHASPLDDYVSRNGKTVCAEIDQVQDGGDVFRLVLTIAKDGGFSNKDAASIVSRSAAAYCPWNSAKLRKPGGSPASAPPPDQQPDQ